MGYTKLAHHSVGGIFEQIFVFVDHLSTRFNRDHSGDGSQGGAFPGTIGADNTYYLALINSEVYAVEGSNPII